MTVGLNAHPEMRRTARTRLPSGLPHKGRRQRATDPAEALTATTIVTGAGRGIGLATAQLLAAQGAGVHAMDIQPPAVSGPPCGDVAWHKVDVTDERQVALFFTEHVRPGSLTGLVNCAGGV